MVAAEGEDDDHGEDDDNAADHAALLKQFDLDSDGKLSIDEILEVTEDIKSQSAVTEEEDEIHKKHNEYLKKVFHESDVDGDGKIDMSELPGMVQKMEEDDREEL